MDEIPAGRRYSTVDWPSQYPWRLPDNTAVCRLLSSSSAQRSSIIAYRSFLFEQPVSSLAYLARVEELRRIRITDCKGSLESVSQWARNRCRFVLSIKASLFTPVCASVEINRVLDSNQSMVGAQEGGNVKLARSRRSAVEKWYGAKAVGRRVLRYPKLAISTYLEGRPHGPFPRDP